MKIVFLIACLTILLSCDNRKDVLLESNQLPSSTIKSLNDWSDNSDKTYKSRIDDTVKLGYDYNFNQLIKDDNKTMKIIFRGNNNGALFEKKGINYILIIDSIATEIKELTYKFTPSSTGNNLIAILTKDVFGKTYINEVYLNAFLNKYPIASLTVRNLPLVGNNTYEFDASNSYDQDAKYGGQIIEYYYEVINNSNLIHSATGSSSKLMFTFANPGTYNISVKVKDDNNVWSSFDIKTITVN